MLSLHDWSMMNMTNAEKIRSMTDEQLLDFMVSVLGHYHLMQIEDTHKDIFNIEWLKREAGEEE